MCDWIFAPTSSSPQTFVRQLTIYEGNVQLDRPVPLLAERAVSAGFCIVQVNASTVLLQPCGIDSNDGQHVLKHLED